MEDMGGGSLWVTPGGRGLHCRGGDGWGHLKVMRGLQKDKVTDQMGENRDRTCQGQAW